MRFDLFAYGFPRAGFSTAGRARRFACSIACGLALVAGAATAADDPLARYAGRVVYLDFWASWCGPCAESFPWLNRMQAKYGDRIVIVGVDVDERAADGAAFLKRHPAEFTILPDTHGTLAERFHIEGMPSTVILDAQGQVLHRHEGFIAAKAAQYEAILRGLLPAH